MRRPRLGSVLGPRHPRGVVVDLVVGARLNLPQSAQVLLIRLGNLLLRDVVLRASRERRASSVVRVAQVRVKRDGCRECAAGVVRVAPVCGRRGARRVETRTIA